MKIFKKKIVELNKGTYQSAKISVKKSKLYTDETFNKLYKMSFDEILKFMEENNYKIAIDNSYLEFKGFYLIERILNIHTSRIYSEIFSSASKSSRELLETYYLKYQIHNLMALVRCFETKEEDLDVYLIGDERKKSKFLKAYKMPKIEDSISYISKKLNLDHIKVLEAYSKGIFYMENYLYKEYYKRLNSLDFKYNNKDEVKFFQYISTYVDLLNARTYMRIKVDVNIDFKFSDLFILGGRETISFFNSLDNLSIEDALKKLNEIFKNISICSDNSCVASLDRRINEHKSKTKQYFKTINFGSPFFLLKYLFDVEREVARLRTLLKSKFLDLSEKEIEELVIK